MKFGLAFANTGPFTTPQGATTLARGAEDAGFESLWTVEHVVVPAGYDSTYPYDPSGKMPGGEEMPIPDPLIWLTYLAASTSTIRLATGILILPQRNPIVLAKELATLDHLSGGRLELGVGVGWLEEEFEAIGVPFRERGRRTDDHIDALRSLWTGSPATFDGPYTSFEDCYSIPRPAQGSIPIHIGGHSEAAAKRAGRVGNGFFPGKGSPEELARLIDLARTTAEQHDRDPDAIEITVAGPAIGSKADETIEAFAELGVDRVMLPAFLFWENTEDALAAYGENVISRFADA